MWIYILYLTWRQWSHTATNMHLMYLAPQSVRIEVLTLRKLLGMKDYKLQVQSTWSNNALIISVGECRVHHGGKVFFFVDNNDSHMVRKVIFEVLISNMSNGNFARIHLQAWCMYFCFQVSHLEPWEKGSRKTAGQTGMCGGVSKWPFNFY